jgi:RNA polymerase sigma-70 factor (ECF subfamily)
MTNPITPPSCGHHVPACPEHRAQFDGLVVPHLDHLHRVAKSILGCEHLSCDAVQAALISLWNLKERPVEAHGWLVRAVVHHSLHLLRHERRRRRHERRAGGRREEACPTCDPARIASDGSAEDWIRQRIAALPDNLREACSLRVDEFDYEAIATRLSLPIGTVRSRLHRARGVLGEALSRAKGSCA